MRPQAPRVWLVRAVSCPELAYALPSMHCYDNDNDLARGQVNYAVEKKRWFWLTYQEGQQWLSAGWARGLPMRPQAHPVNGF